MRAWARGSFTGRADRPIVRRLPVKANLTDLLGSNNQPKPGKLGGKPDITFGTLMDKKYTSIHEKLDPNAIFERGFITKAESGVLDIFECRYKLRVHDGKYAHEGLWGAILTKEEHEIYFSSSSGEPLRVILLNYNIQLLPHSAWGLVITGATDGKEAPLFRRDDQIDRLKAINAAYLKEYPYE